MNSDVLLHYSNILLIFTSLFFAFFLITVKSENKIGNILVSLFLIVRAIDIIPSTFSSISLSPLVDILRMDIGSFFQSPLLFLFTLSIVYSDFKLTSNHLICFSPFIVSTLALLPDFYLANTSEQLSFYNNYTHTFQGKFSYTLAHLQSIFYIIITFILLVKYKKIVLENFSKKHSKNYKWLFQMNIICLVLFISALVKNIYRFGNHFGYITSLRLISSLIMLGFSCWLVLKALYAPELFKGISSKLKLASVLINEKSIKEIELLNTQKVKIEEFMIQKEPFLNPEFTIKDLASQLGMNERELSILINTQFGKNFYEFTSDHRISKAKEILKDKGSSNLTILEILYKVGFNSKSSFNTIFKKNTGVTPTIFRKKNS
ncbi:helix-turn-helix domain-containing protein [Maribacter antarcticus]|uniref:helix-turn-helix domain-containing protein n=1 Tax=Maribacter antarcticus TaxID=505250 RepID=UPI00056122AD|nr:AraC family transcriptional regulator [Maribacter antarcticus]